MESRFAIFDLEMTGRNPFLHEIIEIGLVVADRLTLEVVEQMDWKIRPEHIEDAEPEALEVNKYRERIDEWEKAVSLKEAIESFIGYAKGCKPAGWNIGYDRIFLEYASWRTRGKLLGELPYSWFEIKSVAEEKWLPVQEWERFNLSTVATFAGVPVVDAHSALGDARMAQQVLKKLHGY